MQKVYINVSIYESMAQATLSKPAITVLQCGGTLEASNEDGKPLNHEAKERNYFNRVSRLLERYDINPVRVGRLDSTDITYEHRALMAKTIYDNYERADGFVVVHGTDTMAETAAALNYMLQGIGKPVILTGSQVSIYKPGTDAINNLHCAVQSASSDLGEIAIMFDNLLLRGSRAVKVDACGFHGFDTPRTQPLGERRVNRVGELEVVLANNYARRSNENTPELFTDFHTLVETYQQTSGSESNGLMHLVESEDVHGIVLAGFGTGNVQSRLIPVLRYCAEKHKPVVVVSSCLRGASIDLYEVGCAAFNAGAISGLDLTREAATQKLMYALGLHRTLRGRDVGGRIDFVKRIIQTPIGCDISN